MEELQVANTEMMDSILEGLCRAPSGQLAPHLLEETIVFRSEEHTPIEKWDYIVEISKKPMTILNKKICMGDISSFVQGLCDLEKFYLKPE